MDALSLHIEPSSPEPIYRQIVNQVTRLVAAGHLAAGERMPSVREVATTHAVNPMTVSKAYGVLESEGVLARLRGKGMVVAGGGGPQASVSQRLLTLTPVLLAVARQARELDLPPNTVLQALGEAMSSQISEEEAKSCN